MSDFAYAYFNTELEKLDVPALEGIFEKVQTLLIKKRSVENGQGIDKVEVNRINAVYEKVPREEQLETTKSSMHAIWEAVKNDTW